MWTRVACALGVIAATAAVPRIQAHQSQPPAAAAPSARAPAGDAAKSDEGIPVTSELVKRKCGGCHRPDDKARLSRISYRRTTPEGWEQTIKRMITLNNVPLEPVEARDIVRYLADRHGLAPEEAKPAAFEAERRIIEYSYPGDKDTERTCMTCHSMGRVVSQRRTKEEWTLLLEMHRAIYPGTDTVFRRTTGQRRDAAAQPGNAPPDTRHPMDRAIEHLSSAFPLTTTEWAAWSATMRPPQLQGRWALAGYQPGRGPVFGQVTISSQGDGTSAEFTTQTTFTYALGGQTVARTGRAVVYTGFQWRGRSSGDGTPFPVPGVSSDWREVLFVDRDWRRAEGRWFTGGYNEFGIDVQLRRIGADPILLGAAESMIQAGAARQELHLFGANLPAASPADLNVGPGLTVERIVSSTPTEIVASVSAARDASAGRRSVMLAGATGEASVAVYSTIDYIKVRPQSGLARLGGGGQFPKAFQQFEAIAYAKGPDGKADTKDDVELGLVDAYWSLEEYTATFSDDDKDFVGDLNAESGLFTPALDGPNPKRKHNANNYGDVWVVARYPRTLALAGGSGPQPVKGRAHLLVTVPVYILFDQPEVAR